jgi:3-keto-5-aminohexanoate cleavage enzyme
VIATGTPAVITCPIIGGFPSRNPHHPQTFADIVRHGIEAARAGAAILHIHARTKDGEPSQDPAVYEALAAEIRSEVPDVVLNYTTGGSPGMSEDERLGPLQAHPSLASLDCGTLNFGDQIFENSPAFIRRAAADMRAAGVTPEIECFEAGMVVTGARLVQEGLIDAPALFQFVLGVPGGAPARVDTLCHLVALLPPGANWAAAAIGAPHFALMAAALAMGGHIRTGMEDVAYLSRGTFVEHNAQLVTRAVELCAAIGRPVATASQARDILQLDAGRGGQ